MPKAGLTRLNEERVKLASLCVRDIGTMALVLVDEMNNPVWQLYGPAANLAYLIDTDGMIIEAQAQYDVDRMERVIQRQLKG